MSQRHSITVWAALIMAVIGGIAAGFAKAENSSAVKALFTNPPKEYSSAPLWVWNDDMTEETVISTLRDLASQGIRQAFIHPRPGLMTPYLSQEWFRLWKIALAEAKRLDMNLWIYDENSYPSGFAGGWVPELMPESVGMGLSIREVNQPMDFLKSAMCVFRPEGDGYKNVTEQLRASKEKLRAGDLEMRVKKAGRSGWYGGRSYVNLLTKGVTEKFLEVTMDAYKREIGPEFGKRMPGVFTDEPQVLPAGDMPWCTDLPEVFEKRWGYSLVDNLPSLVRQTGDWHRVRHNYWQVVLELFIERWAKPYYEYCEKNMLEFTGHYWEHEWPRCGNVADNMAMSAWQQRPGIDILFNQYNEDVHAQFGNVRSVKELAGIANQLGRRRTLCEAYGGSGWELRLEDMKRIGDWLLVLGVNMLDEHLSDVSIRGARKADYPQSFSYHEPWWDSYHTLTGYFTRLSAAMSQGQQVNSILVIEPTTTVWMYQPDPNHARQLEKIGGEFQKLVVALAKAQVQFDIGCEDVIARNGSVEGATLGVGKRGYTAIVMPPMTENLNAKTAELIEAYTNGGGQVFCCGEPPALVEGRPAEAMKAAAKGSGWRQVAATDLAAMLLAGAKDGFAVKPALDNNGIVLSHRRRLDDGDLVLITNTSISSPAKGTVESAGRGVERWDAETGKISPYAYRVAEKGIEAQFEIAPCGSILLFLSNNKIDLPDVTSPSQEEKIAPKGPMNIRRIGQNVLTLDYLDVNVADKSLEKTFFYKAGQTVFGSYGFDGDPWDHAVQFKDELISKKFDPNSGFEATYRFTIEEKLPKSLYIVIERPDLYTITCNGRKVSAKKGDWWLDKSFGRIDIRSLADIGENTVTIRAMPFTLYHEIAPVYLLGDFALKPAESGFIVIPDKPLELGAWKEQGRLYAQGVSYAQTFELVKTGRPCFVELPDWYGSVAKVTVNGKPAGYIWHQPWRCDVTDFVKKGKNDIEVTVIGTLRNTLGPHHADRSLGMVSPWSFRRAPNSGPPAGEKYFTIRYGLFAPFELVGR